MINTESVEIEERYQLIQRITESSLFQKSPRLRDFLSYAADCTLENRLDDVREQVIAERVFGRRPELHGQDSIVRAEARNLRKRLETYFATEGKDEPVLVSMPKGAYALAFETRSVEIAAPALVAAVVQPSIAPVEQIVSVIEQAAARTVKPIRGRFGWVLAIALAALIASGFAVNWYRKESRLERQLGSSAATLPFSALLSDSNDALVITSDTGLLQISSLAHRRITLDEYMARSYPDVPNIEPNYLIRNWNIWEFTDSREMAIAGLILSHNARFAGHINLRSGHEVQLEDFKNKSVILIGSPISNPWAQLYEDKLNFRCDLTGDQRILFRNLSPQKNERAQFPDQDDIQHNRTYARLAFLPRTSDAAPALLIAGTTAQSTAAAGELVITPERLNRTLRSIGIDPKGPPHFFEILIRSNTFVSGAILPEIIAWRTKPAPER